MEAGKVMFKGEKKIIFSHLAVLMIGLTAGWWFHGRFEIPGGENIISPRNPVSEGTGSDDGSFTAPHIPQEKYKQREKEVAEAVVRFGDAEPANPSRPAGRTLLPPHGGEEIEPSPKSDPSADEMQKAISFYDNRDFVNLLLFVQEHEYPLGAYYPRAVSLLKNLLLTIAVELTNKGYPQKAVESIDAYLEFDPYHFDGIDMKATIFSREGRAVEAYDLYMDARFLTNDPVVQTDLRNKASGVIDARILSLSAQEKWKELMEFYDRILERNPDKPEKYQLGLARLHLKFNRPDTAKSIAEEVLLTDSTNPEAVELIKQIEKGSPDEDLIVIPVIKRKNQYYVDAVINNEIETVLLIDTGATYCSLASSVVDELASGSVTDLGEKKFNTAGGTVTNTIARIDSIAIGEALVKNLQVSVSGAYSAQSHMKGLLGMNFLSLFDLYFDQERDRLILQKKP